MNHILIVGNCGSGEAGTDVTLTAVPLSWDCYDDVDFLVWDPAAKGALLSYNSSAHQLIHVDIATGTFLAQQSAIEGGREGGRVQLNV